MKSYGTDVTEHKLGHRMRHLKTQAEIIRRGLQQGFDPKDMPTEFNFPKDQNKIDTGMCLVGPLSRGAFLFVFVGIC